ncbi:MAG: TnpV protein [Dialister sp.]|nr:TnpV protein [Dialister sp.]
MNQFKENKMNYEEMTIDELTPNSSTFSMEQTDEIAERIEEEMLDALEQETAFMEAYPNPTYAVLRLQYLTRSETQETWTELLNRYEDESLLSHLMTCQEEAIQLIRKIKPQYQTELGLTEELKQENPEDYQRRENNLSQTLREIAIQLIVEQ